MAPGSTGGQERCRSDSSDRAAWARVRREISCKRIAVTVNIEPAPRRKRFWRAERRSPTPRPVPAVVRSFSRCRGCRRGGCRRRAKGCPRQSGEGHHRRTVEHDQRRLVEALSVPTGRRTASRSGARLGRPDAAAAGDLYVVTAGAPGALRTAAPLDAVGQKTFTVSEKPEVATIIKLSGNFLTAAVVEPRRGDGAGRQVGSTSTKTWTYALRLVRRVRLQDLWGSHSDGKFELAAFAAPLGSKDLRRTLAAVEVLRVPRRSPGSCATFPLVACPWR